jgi:tetratricopeptide (TPR) repeat protein
MKILTTKFFALTIIFCSFFLINLSATTTIKTTKSDTNSYFEKANKFYEKSQFQNALEIYKNLYSQGLVSTDLLYNISNSYYKIGKIGYSYVFIERAFRLSPRDEDIKYNRKFILSLLGQKSNPLDILISVFSINELIFIGLFFYCVLFLFLIFGIFFEIFAVNRTWYWLKMINLFIVIFMTVWIFFVYQIEYKDQLGVSISQDVPVYASPDIASKAIFTMPEGKKFIIEKIEKYDTNWCAIYIQDKSLKGWIKKENMEILLS